MWHFMLGALSCSMWRKSRDCANHHPIVWTSLFLVKVIYYYYYYYYYYYHYYYYINIIYYLSLTSNFNIREEEESNTVIQFNRPMINLLPLNWSRHKTCSKRFFNLIIEQDYFNFFIRAYHLTSTSANKRAI